MSDQRCQDCHRKIDPQRCAKCGKPFQDGAECASCVAKAERRPFGLPPRKTTLQKWVREAKETEQSDAYLREWLRTKIGGETHVDTLRRFSCVVENSGIENSGEWAWWLDDLATELDHFVSAPTYKCYVVNEEKNDEQMHLNIAQPFVGNKVVYDDKVWKIVVVGNRTKS